ncbi:MAG: outer membrane lipid asymmetry maintenance protein MlaD [Gammaproteobacteria bacterium]|nr:outer membrane lipid asymmetry maintenance protein MlaD [Gammaproteobacteria bacterium]
MNLRVVEIGVGIFVAIGLAALLILSLQVSNLTLLDSGPSYRVTARFENISGLKVGAPVSVAGVKVGEVIDISFDSKSYEAVVKLTISKKYDQLPIDSQAGVRTTGLLGEKYITLIPGSGFNPWESDGVDGEKDGGVQLLVDGSEIHNTSSSMVLEDMIGQFLFSKGDEGGR